MVEMHVHESVLCELYICMSLLLLLVLSEVQKRTLVLLYVSNIDLLFSVLLFTFRNMNLWLAITLW